MPEADMAAPSGWLTERNGRSLRHSGITHNPMPEYHSLPGQMVCLGLTGFLS
jgi:hypothetical protein